MREIKFRAWSNDAGWNHEKRMAIPYRIDFEERVVACHDWHIHRMLEDCDWLSLSKAILMQFTGLHGKNGKEIYEGDILKHAELSNDPAFVVEWEVIDGTDDYADFYAGYGLNSTPNEYEVIGNVYENPELLEKAHV